MATKKKNTSTVEKMNSTSMTKSLEVKPELQGKVRVEPVLEVINSAGLKKKNFLKCVDSANVMKLEFVQDFKNLTKDELLQWFQDKAERIRGIEIADRIKAERAVSEFDKIVSLVYGESSGFKVEIDPAGGVTCSYSNITRLSLEYDWSIEHFSYKLERKAVNERIWVPIASSNYAWGCVVINDSTVKIGTKYTYRMTVTNLVTDEKKTYQETILYDKLEVEIVNFVASPDPVYKKIVLKFTVKNATTVKIVRTDNEKEITSPYYDTTDVEKNKKYEYVLTASNCWTFDNATAVADCKNLFPTTGKITYEVDSVERGVTLRWASSSNSSFFTVERKLSTDSSWTEICSNSHGYSYRDIDESENEEVLKIGTTYDYRVKYANEWDSAYSAIVSIKMTNSVPQMPRMLDPGRFCTIQWTRANNVKSYEVKRFDNSNDTDFDKIDRDEITCGRSWLSLKNNENFVKDDKIKNGVRYLYKIVAKNGWGKSVARYQDVFVPKEFLGKIYNDAYSYKSQVHAIARLAGKNWTRDFQGITTDGQWWYITNGVSRTGEYARLTKGHVNKSLDRSISNDYSKTGMHFGDLDCFQNYLFIAVDETKHPEIWIFDKEKPKYICKCQLQKSNGEYFDGLAWCAVNPCDGRLYTSENYINSGSPIYSYKIEWDNIGTSKEIFPKDSERQIYLYDQNGNPCIKEAMQGGCFDYFNNIYLTSGCGKKDSEGVHVFKLIRDDSVYFQETLNRASGETAKSQVFEAYKSNSLKLPFDCVKAVLIARSTQSGSFKYQFDSSGDICGNYPQEPEGLAYFDFANNSITPYHDSMKDTSLHIGLLDNKPSLVDGVYMKSYYHRYRETEIKNIYYDPSNIKVVGCDILDNKILVKRFSSQDIAEKALNILKKFKSIRTIGWLLTSSPNYNYEFSAIECNTTLSKRNCTKISYVGTKVSLVQENERWVVMLNPSASKVYSFYAHNKADAKRIYGILSKYNKVCIIGDGADADGRIRSANNLIWLEK